MNNSMFLKFIDAYSYERYENFDALETRSRFYPLQVPMKNTGKLYPCAELSKGTASEKLIAKLAYYTQGILRCEPQNPYFYHAAVPSARGIHPCECYYLIFNGKWIVLRYNKLFNAFELCRECREDNFPFSLVKNKIYILVVADLWRLAAFYGAFSYLLSLIDSGHILAQIMLISSYNNCKTERCDTVCSDMFGRLFDIDVTELVPVSMMSVELPEHLTGSFVIPENFNEPCRAVSYASDIKRFKMLNSVLNSIKKYCSTADVILRPCGNIHLIFDSHAAQNIYKLFNERSSGQSSLGTFSLLPVLSGNDVNRIAYDIYSSVSTIGQDMLSSVKIFVNDSVLSDRSISSELDIHMFSEIDPSEFIHDSHSMLNIESMPFIVITTFELAEYIEKYGALAVNRIYTDAGILMQLVSLCLTEKGFFARPLKNINEKYIESLPFMNKSERVSYMLIAGCENTYSVKIPFSNLE